MLRRLATWIAGPARAAAAGLQGVRRNENARSLGQTSRGKGQARGNGTLVLTQDALHFFLWVPRRPLAVPLAAITRVDTATCHLGKWVAARLLRVTWRGPEGEDAIALQVHDLDGWLRDLGGPSG